MLGRAGTYLLSQKKQWQRSSDLADATAVALAKATMAQPHGKSDMVGHPGSRGQAVSKAVLGEDLGVTKPQPHLRATHGTCLRMTRSSV